MPLRNDGISMNLHEHNNRYPCPVCNLPTTNDDSFSAAIGCDGPCNQWFHRTCSRLTVSQFHEIRADPGKTWACQTCGTSVVPNAENEVVIEAVPHNAASSNLQTTQIPQPSLKTLVLPSFPQNDVDPVIRSTMKWGILKGHEEIANVLQVAYDEVVKWKKNFFRLPHGACGKGVVEEAAKLLSFYNEKSPLENLAIKTLIVFIPLILQKPSKNSKNKDHKEHLKRRLQLWKNGYLQLLINEVREIQK